MNTLTPSQQEIALRAYQLYLESGGQHGQDWNHWFQAEQEIAAKYATPFAGNAVEKASNSKPSDGKNTQSKVSNTKADAKKVPAKKAAAKKGPTKKTTGKK